MELTGQLNVRVIFNVKFNSGGHNCYSLKEINQTKFVNITQYMDIPV